MLNNESCKSMDISSNSSERRTTVFPVIFFFCPGLSLVEPFVNLRAPIKGAQLTFSNQRETPSAALKHVNNLTISSQPSIVDRLPINAKDLSILSFDTFQILDMCVRRYLYMHVPLSVLCVCRYVCV